MVSRANSSRGIDANKMAQPVAPCSCLKGPRQSSVCTPSSSRPKRVFIIIPPSVFHPTDHNPRLHLPFQLILHFPRLLLCPQQPAQIPARHHTQLVRTRLADAQLAPCTCPLAITFVGVANHTAQGLECVVAPDGCAVRGVAVELRGRNFRDQTNGERDVLAR